MEYQAAMAHEKKPMKVSVVTTRDLQLIKPTQTIREAARLVVEMDASIMPVRGGDRLFGMITDRDIALRASSKARDPAPLSAR
jgi:CBS domain-containing protein